MHVNWKGVGAAALSLFGIVSSPAVMNLFPPHIAAAVAGAGMIAQAFTHKAVSATPPTP